MKLFVLFVVLSLAVTEINAQEDLIYWNEKQSLKWDDFKGQVDNTSIYYAATFASIRYRYQYLSNGKTSNIKFEVSSYFTKSKSWSKKDKQTEALLRHEQLHFDITELHARKLKEELEKNSYTDNYKAEIAGIFSAKKAQLKEMEDRYDEETNHSQNKDKQAEWESYTSKELRKYQPTNKE